MTRDERIGVLYLAPWIDYGGSDTSTLDWFRWMDRTRFASSLVTTQPSSNRRVVEAVPFAEEIWVLPELMAGLQFPHFIAEFIQSREIRVVHIMNSRIGFDLLPDLRALPSPPKVVVQLHVEEPTRDGYVRYVTTRYGNLVDAYTVSSAHVGEAVVGYGIAPQSVVTIPTGIDTHVFSPGRVAPQPGLEADLVHLLFIARLVEQKDPLLMVEVARELAARELPFCIHVIGGGELEPQVRAAVRDGGLQKRVVFEPPTHELRSWYEAADLMLMTSVFEGVPVIVYEALSMGVPIVAPDLPGIRELMGDGGGSLVARRDRPRDYADALEPLISSSARRLDVGAQGREIVGSRFSVQQMADQHGELYERLVAEAESAPRQRGRAPEAREPPASSREPTLPVITPLLSRPARGQPRVSVITPCFNHGRLLRECVASIAQQTYPDVEMIVVDDGSQDPDTKAYLAELAGEGEVRVIHMRRNGGPSAARNRGIRACTGRYVLPVDADNLLLPDAIERLVAQLQCAGAHVGFIYQNCQYFGNREDYFEPPIYNPWILTRQNFIDTCALIDREVFDRGLRYAEDIVFGHEDWDFFLRLASFGIQGEPARTKTLLYRKEGFTRSDLVEWTGSTYHAEQVERHPDLMPSDRPYVAPSRKSVRLKAQWAPAVSIVALSPFELTEEAWRAASAGLAAQRLRDFELLVALDGEPPDAGLPIRRLPSRLAPEPAEQLAYALELARGRHLLLTNGGLPDLLADGGSVERITRCLERAEDTVLCLAEDRRPSRYPFAVIEAPERGCEPHAVAIPQAAQLELPAQLDRGDPLGGLMRALYLARRPLQWRHLPAPWSQRIAAAGRFHVTPRPPRPPRPERAERKIAVAAAPAYPAARGQVARWMAIRSWLPACTAPLVRHRRLGALEWTATTSLDPPPGYYPEWYLGVVHLRALPGTARIACDPEQGYRAIGRDAPPPSSDEMDDSVGYADEVAFALLEPLLVCRHGPSGLPVLTCGEDDPLRGELEMAPLEVLGYVDRFPINPHEVPGTGEVNVWLRGLVRAMDGAARRHRAVLDGTQGPASWELGALLDRDPGGGIPVWLDAEGRLSTDAYAPTRHPFDVQRTLRWLAAPASWRGFGRYRARGRATLRRGAEALRHTLSRPGIAIAPAHEDAPQAWLLPEPGPDRVALYSAVHPITADQLLTRDVSEARELGYGTAQILGYAIAAAPVTGTLTRPVLSVPWGSRFGETLTLSEDPL
jgi:glycosyltransferase involved in cell wall biosynthesis